MERFDTVWHDARLATFAGHGPGIVEDGVVAAREGLIVFAGPRADLPVGWDARERIGCDGRWRNWAPAASATAWVPSVLSESKTSRWGAQRSEARQSGRWRSSLCVRTMADSDTPAAGAVT